MSHSTAPTSSKSLSSQDEAQGGDEVRHNGPEQQIISNRRLWEYTNQDSYRLPNALAGVRTNSRSSSDESSHRESFFNADAPSSEFMLAPPRSRGNRNSPIDLGLTI